MDGAGFTDALKKVSGLFHFYGWLTGGTCSTTPHIMRSIVKYLNIKAFKLMKWRWDENSLNSQRPTSSAANHSNAAAKTLTWKETTQMKWPNYYLCIDTVDENIRKVDVSFSVSVIRCFVEFFSTSYCCRPAQLSIWSAEVCSMLENKPFDIALCKKWLAFAFGAGLAESRRFAKCVK